MLRRALLTLTAVAILWATLLALTGGFDIQIEGVRLRSRNPDRALYAAGLLIVIYALCYRTYLRRHWQQAVSLIPDLAGIERVAVPMTLVLSISVCVVGITHGVLVAGGSDSWGYVSQAGLWLKGNLVVDQPIATGAPWPDADWTFTPLGYRLALRPGAIVPMYAPGLPLLMAAAQLVLGACGPFVVTPILGAVTVSLTYVLGTQLWSPLAGLAGATLMATSPAFLFMLMNPMSDVPVTAFFLLGLVTSLSSWRTRAFWTGAAVGVATLIRPNLVPLGVIYLGFLLVRARTDDPAHRVRAMWRAGVWYCVGTLPSVAAIAAVNTYLYGAPWKSGYGTADQLYAWRWLWPNVTNYSRFLWQKETAFVLLTAVALVWLRRFTPRRRSAVLFVACFAAGVWLSYLAYEPFDAWWFLRFLLPSFPVILLLSVIGLALLLRRTTNARVRKAIAVLVVIGLAVTRVRIANGELVFELWKQGISYVSAAEYVRTQLPANAVVVSGQHSGSIRYYANRLTMRWDGVSQALWPRALMFLEERGYRPYLLVTDSEDETLRRQFGLSDAVDALGTLVAVLEKPERIRIYDPLRIAPSLHAPIPAVVPCPCGCLDGSVSVAADRYK